MQPIVASLITFIYNYLNFQLQLKLWWPVFQFSFHHFLLFRDKCWKYRTLTDHRSVWDYLETKMILSCAERRGQPPHCGVPPPTLTPQITSSTSAQSYRRKQLQITCVLHHNSLWPRHSTMWLIHSIETELSVASHHILPPPPHTHTPPPRMRNWNILYIILEIVFIHPARRAVLPLIFPR